MEIDEAYLQHSVALTTLSGYTPKPSTIHLDTNLLESVGSSLFTTTSSIISTTLHSTDSFFPKQPFQPRILFPSSTTSSSSPSISAAFSNTSFSFPRTSSSIPTSFSSISTTFSSTSSYIPISSASALTTSASSSSYSPSTSNLPPSQARIQAMAARYAPLVLPA